MKKPKRRLPKYVIERPGTQFYWFSRARPKRVWDLEGRNPIQFSLETSNLSNAEKLARHHAASLDIKWGLVPRPMVLPVGRREPTVDELEEAAMIVANDLLLEEADEGRKSLRGKGPVMWKANANWVSDELLEQQRYAATGVRA